MASNRLKKFYSDKKVLENRNILKGTLSNSSKIDNLGESISGIEDRTRRKIDNSTTLILGAVNDCKNFSKEELEVISASNSTMKKDMDIMFHLLVDEVMRLRSNVNKLFFTLFMCLFLVIALLLWR